MALFIVIVVPLLIQLGLWLRQPMFHNTFMAHDKIPFYVWAPPSPYFDDRGNAAVADFRRNLLVVFLTADSDFPTMFFYYPRSRKGGGAVFRALDREDSVEFGVSDTINTLLVFGADGKQSGFPLAVGEAECFFNLMRWIRRPPDLVPFVEQAYADQHSPESVASLREAIAELKMSQHNDAGDGSKEAAENAVAD